MRKDSGMLPLWEPFSVFFALWYIEVCYDILDGHIQYIHWNLYICSPLLSFCTFSRISSTFLFHYFFHIDFLVFSVIFSFQFFVPFSLMIMFWYFFVLVYVQACSNLHQGSWLHPKDGVFFLMLNQSSGAVDVYGIMQSAIAVLSSHMLLFVALYIILFIHV